MHIRAQRPILVPDKYLAEIERLSKAALMDMVWDFAFTSGNADYAPPADQDGSDGQVMEVFRARRDIILTHRRQAIAKGE